MAATRPVLSRSLLIVLFALLVAPEVVLADNTADEADLRFRRGVAHYQARRYEDALADFFHSHRLVPNRNVLHNIARCYEQLRLFDEAYRYYNDVLQDLPEDEDRGSLEASLERLAPRVALLHVETGPPSAEIFIDRRDLGSRGTSPTTLALAPGETTVILSLPGHREIVTTAELMRGETVRLESQLDFIYGRLAITGPPEGTEVRLDRHDGELVGIAPGNLTMRPGRHIVHIGAADHVPVQVPVKILPEEETSLELSLDALPPPTGTLVVTANHDSALVQAGGRDIGFTPLVAELPIGSHRVLVSMTEMRTHEEEIELDDGGRAHVQAVLRFVGAKTTAASKIEVPVEEAPASITVISREEIMAFGYTSLPEALQAVRGLFVSNDRTYEYLGVRGFSPPGDLNSRILILYDGHTMNDVYAGQAYLGRENSLDLEDVERIEVVRGPVSSLFGSAAFLGVINIVPRERAPGSSVDLTASAGSLGLARARGTFSHSTDDTEVTVSLGAMTTRGEDVFFLPAQEELPEVVIRDRDGERVYGGHARARFRNLRLFGRINSRSKNVPTGAYYTLLTEPSMEMHDQRSFVEMRYQPELSRGALLTARAFYDATRYSGRFRDEDGEQLDFGEADWVGAELRYRSPEWLRQHITLGLEYQGQLRVYQSVFYDDVLELDDTRSFHVASAYLVDELKLGESLILNASARLDQYIGSFGTTINPRLAFIWKNLPGGVTKLMGGQSFRAPNAYERFYEDGPIDPLTGERDYRSARADPDLGPEMVQTLELEHSQHIGDELRLAGAIWVNRITDLIVHTADAGEEFTYRANAGGAVRTEGGEIELRWQPARLAMVSAAYWYQQMHISGLDDEEEEGRLRANTPAHAFSIRGMFPISAPFIIGSAEGIFNSSRLTYEGEPTGEFFLLNLGLSGQLVGGRFNYFAGVRNLLDERVQLPAGDEVPRTTLPSLGRTFMLQVGTSY